jgi:hypothetical protein
LKRLLWVLFVPALALLSCSSLRGALPLMDGPPPPSLTSSVFVGYAKAFHFSERNWVRVPEYDYEFLVLERRYAGYWNVIKEIHHRHPRYDGRAGPRDQTLYFLVRTSPASDGGLDLAVEGTLGAGKGHEEAGGGLVIEMASAKTGWFIPFNTVRIRQTRGATEGRLAEVVELLLKRDKRENPFMKMQEEGIVYRPIVP